MIHYSKFDYMKHYNIKVTGHVQNVSFRACTHDKALKLGIFGFVRNEPDGSVYIEVEGECEAVNSFLVDIREGYGGLKIVKTESQQKGYKSFEVKF